MSGSYEDKMCEWVEMYALDGLEEHEKVAFEHHLSECPVCRNQLAELRRVVELLPTAARPVPLPSGMRERVLERVLGDAAYGRDSAMVPALPSRQQSYGAGRWRASESGRADRKVAEPLDGVSGLSRKDTYTERSVRKAGYWRWISLGLAAAVIGLGVYAYGLKSSLNELQMKLASASSELDTANKKLASATSELAADKKPAEALKVNKIAALYPAAEDIVSKGWVTIAIDAKGTHLVVQAEDLPPITQEQAFQVWLIKDNQPVNAGTFYPLDGKGSIYYTFEPKDYDTVSVTLEPDAHGQKPRGTVVLAAGLKG